MSTENIETKKRRSTSLPLLVGFLILGAVGYLFGEKIMTYAFYLQEGMIAKSGTKGADVPQGIKPEVSADPNVGSGPSPEGPGAGGPGAGGPGGGGPGGGAPSAGGPNAGGPGAGGDMDPEELFAQRDKDSNGKLEADEISERMQTRLTEVDTDQDKAVSKDEFLTAWRNRQTTSSSSGTGTQRPASDSAPATEPPATEPPATEPPATSADVKP